MHWFTLAVVALRGETNLDIKAHEQMQDLATVHGRGRSGS